MDQLFQQRRLSCSFQGLLGAARPISPAPAARRPGRQSRGRCYMLPTAAAAQDTAEQSMYSSPAGTVTSFGFKTGFGDRFEVEERLGSGAFAIVHAVRDRKTGERFAVKTMPKRFGPDGTLETHFVRRVRNEVDICNHLGRALNICYLYEMFEDDQCVDLVMELCSGGQLWDRILKGKYSEQQAARLVQEVLRTVAQCHAKGVLMRDVKPENFLFLNASADSPLKAIDFGISIFCQPGQYVTHRAGTPIYLAPEVVRQHYSLPADVWSAGIMSYLLLTGRLPFAGEEGLEVSEQYMTKQLFNNKDTFRAILYSDLDFELPPWDTISADARDFVQLLLQRDEAKRPTADEALQHRWLCNLSTAPDAPLSDTIVQRLQRFGTYGKLKQVALCTVAHGIAADSSLIQDLRDMFCQLDPQATGRVPYSRLQQALQDGQFTLSMSETQQLMSQIDIDSSGDIDFDEFIASMVDWRKVQDTPEWDALVQRAFDAMDSAHNGRIGLEDLELVLCGKDGCEFPDTVDAALREADVDHDGGISLPEFKRLLATQPSDRLDLFESRLAKQGAQQQVQQQAQQQQQQ